MFILDIMIALLFALVVGGLFSLAFRISGPWSAFWVFLLILFLGTWAGGLWITPVGPVLWEVYWVPFLATALIFAVLLAAIPPVDKDKAPRLRTLDVGADKKKLELAALGLFFWLLLVVLVLAIVLGYLLAPIQPLAV